jgi:hypothetical protein
MSASVCLVLVTLGVGSSRVLQAECLIPAPPCQALAQASLVLVADVLEATLPWAEIGPLGPHVVTLRVVERFKGVLPQQKQLTLKIPIQRRNDLARRGETISDLRRPAQTWRMADELLTYSRAGRKHRCGVKTTPAVRPEISSKTADIDPLVRCR